jgi:hypothetical protein
MVPFVLASAWAVRHWNRLRNRTALAVAMAAYFGWLAAFDVYYVLVEEWRMGLAWWYVREVAGIPTFLLGCALLVAVVRAATRQVPVVATGPQSCSDV